MVKHHQGEFEYGDVAALKRQRGKSSKNLGQDIRKGPGSRQARYGCFYKADGGLNSQAGLTLVDSAVLTREGDPLQLGSGALVTFVGGMRAALDKLLSPKESGV